MKHLRPVLVLIIALVAGTSVAPAHASNPNCLVNGTNATLNDLGFELSALGPGETNYATIGGVRVTTCNIIGLTRYWAIETLNGNQVNAYGGQVSSITINPTALTYDYWVQRFANFATPATFSDGDVFVRYLYDQSTAPTLGVSVPAGSHGFTFGSSAQTLPQTNSSPPKYSGPEFTDLFEAKVSSGASIKLEGRRLDQISSIEIGGKAATFSAATAAQLGLSVPADLAPGVYDLVIISSAGKLTQINAIEVREPLRAFSFTSQTSGKVTEEKFHEHAIVATIQEPELNKARCIVNAKSPSVAKAQAQRLCALIKAANPNIVTTVIDARSTVKTDLVYARVVYGWN